MSNTQEQSMVPKGMTPEEVAKLSDEEIMQLLIKEKRQRLAMHDANIKASIRRRRR